MQQLFLALVLALVTHCGAAFAAAGPVNINTANLDELVALSGIGPAKAQAILDYRNAHGPFKSVDDLKNVKGIGAKQLEKLRSDITVGTAIGEGGCGGARAGQSRPARQRHHGQGPCQGSAVGFGPEVGVRDRRASVRRAVARRIRSALPPERSPRTIRDAFALHRASGRRQARSAAHYKGETIP